MADYSLDPTEVVYDGETYTVPGIVAAFNQAYVATGGTELIGATVGEFLAALDPLLDYIKSQPWDTILSYMTPGDEGYDNVAAFAAGDFSLLEQGFAELRAFLEGYPPSTPTIEAFMDIEGYGDALDTGIKTFLETAENQTLEGSADTKDAVTFANDRAAYEIRLDADGQLVIAGPEGGSAKLLDIEKLVFSDFAYNLEIHEKAAAIGAEVLDSLVDLYIAYFNRAPEAEGLGYWIDQYQAGASLESIASAFYQAGVQFSAQTGYAADMPLADFVTLLYSNVLGRSGETAPPDADVAYWVDRIETGADSRESVVARMLHDARTFADDPDFGWVTDLLDNRVEFGKVHAILFGIDYQDPDEAYATSQELASLVTAEGTDAAVNAVGLGADDYIGWA